MPAALDQLAARAGGDDRWLWFQVRGLVRQALALAETPPSARLVGRVLSAIALGLIPNLLTRRLSPEAVAWACSQCRVDHPLEQQAVAVGLRQVGLLRATGPVVEFAHPMLADWFAAEYIAEYVPEKVLRLPGGPRLRRWAVENIIAAGDLQLAGRLSAGVLGSLPGRHPVCGLGAAALLAPLVRALPDQSLQRQWEQLAERLQPLGPVRSWRVQALLREC